MKCYKMRAKVQSSLSMHHIHTHSATNTEQHIYWLLGLRFLPGPTTTFTKRRLYFNLWLARPLGFLGLSCFSTLGHWPRTLPARARDPWTFPAFPYTHTRKHMSNNDSISREIRKEARKKKTSPPKWTCYSTLLHFQRSESSSLNAYSKKIPPPHG